MNFRADIALDSGTLKKSLEEISGGFVNLVTEDGRRIVTESGAEVVTESDLFYEGDILKEIAVTTSMSDVFYGMVRSNSFTLPLANGDGEWDAILAAEEVRGRSVTVRKDSGKFWVRGKISKIDIKIDSVELTIEPTNDEIFDTLLPAAVVTATDFTVTAVDIGYPIPVIFGHCKGVPLANIQNNTDDDYYDYLVGFGPVESLWIDHANGRGVKRDGVLVDESEYTFYDGSQASPYNGYAFIRFTVEQKDFSGNFHSLTADVKGLELGGTTADRNFANVIKAILENTTWGLSETVDATSFATAAAALPTTSFMCDGVLYEKTAVRDTLTDLLFVARGRLSRDASGAWRIAVDGTGSSVASFGDHDGYWDNCKITSVSLESSDKAIRKAVVTYDSDSLRMELDVNAGFGVERTYSLPNVSETDTAVKAISYIYGRGYYAGKQITLDADSDAENVVVGDVVSISSGPRNLSAVSYKVIEITERLNDYSLTCESYSASIFDDQSPSEPTANTDSTDVHALQTIESGSVGGWAADETTLANGTNIILDAINKAISINSAVFGALGIQIQYNSGTPRFYVGDGSTKYFKFDGTDTSGNYSGVVNMASQGGCKVYRTADQTISDSTVTTIQFNNETWDTRNEWNASTYRFTLENDSKLLITVQILSAIVNWTLGNQWEIEIFKNGAQVAAGGALAWATANNMYLIATCGVSLDCDAGDYIEFKVYHDRGSNTNLWGTEMYSWATIQKVA